MFFGYSAIMLHDPTSLYVRKGYSNFNLQPNSAQSKPKIPSYCPLQTNPWELHMLMHNSATTPLPCSEQDAAVSALVIDVLEAGHEVWDTAEAEDEADEDTPDAVMD